MITYYLNFRFVLSRKFKVGLPYVFCQIYFSSCDIKISWKYRKKCYYVIGRPGGPYWNKLCQRS